MEASSARRPLDGSVRLKNLPVLGFYSKKYAKIWDRIRGLEGDSVIIVSGSQNKPGCSAGDSIPKKSGFFRLESEKMYMFGTFVLLSLIHISEPTRPY